MPRFRRTITTERRASRRVLASDVIPQGVTRLATGQEVRLVNIALNGGILIHCKTMLSPGSYVRLRLNIPDSAMLLEGRIHRCKVIGLKQAKIQYEAAILLEGEFPEPLGGILRSLDEESSSREECPQEICPDGLTLSEAAQLWIMDSQGAEITA